VFLSVASKKLNSWSSIMIEYKKNHQAYFILDVTDLQVAKDFYADIFGFEVLFDHKKAGLIKEFGWVELSLPFHGARLGLNLIRKGRVKQGSGQLCFYVTDINAAREYVERKGVLTDDVPDDHVGMGVGRSKYGYDAFVMYDPFENEILFVGNDTTKVTKRGDEIGG
jgi:catechol 2,3-dioxygenase-like lactoylglutathione lyase family enzyme